MFPYCRATSVLSEKMHSYGDRRYLCLLFQGRLRPVQPVLLREALRPVRAGAYFEAAPRAAPCGGCHRGCAGEGQNVDLEVVQTATGRKRRTDSSMADSMIEGGERRNGSFQKMI